MRNTTRQLLASKKDVSEMQAMMFEESQSKINLQMIADSKDAEIEQLHARLKQLESLCNRDLKTISLPKHS